MRAAVLISLALLGNGAASAAPIPAPSHDISVSTPTYLFEYSYPAAAGRIPALKAWLAKDAAAQQADIAAKGSEGLKKAGKAYDRYNRYAEWRVVADLPGWLSLSGSREGYTGGPHADLEFTALLWERKRGLPLEPVDLFISKSELSQAIRAPFCSALNRKRAARRSKPIDPKNTNVADACFDPVSEVIILGSADHAHFTRIGVLMGPYAPGAYEVSDVTVPVTPAVLAAVRPEYRSAFALALPPKSRK